MSSGPTVAPIVLELGELRLALTPDLGGSIAGLWHRGNAVLRSTEPGDLRGPRDSACFPLIPYSNRLADRRFAWLGQNYTTQPNFDDSPHSLHGVGWQRPWALKAQGETDATLAYRHAADADWPFSFDAEQRFALTADSLQMTIRLTNTDLSDQPVGLGWHPYFLRRNNSRLQMAVTTRWDHDARQIPTLAVPQPAIDAAVESLAFDHCFGGWNGHARITDDSFTLRLASSLSYAVVFTPPGKPHFCVEPVSHLNDAIHRADPRSQGLLRLRPGEHAEAVMSLQIEAH